MKGMMDATCPKCRKRIGWFGEVTDRPPCPRCGHQIPLKDLEADQKKLERVFKEMEEGS